MKIAYFVDDAPVIGGSGNVLLEQAKIMSSIHEVVVVIPLNEKGEMNPEYPLRCQRIGLRYVVLEYATTFCIQFIDIVKAYRDAEHIKKWAIHEKINFFHSSQLNISVEYAARRMGIPHLMNIYQLREEEFALKCMDIFPRYHSCDSLLYCSVWSENLDIKSRCIRPSAPLNNIQKKKKDPKREIRILMLGGFQERKNQMAAIQAVEICNENGQNVRLTIAGDDTSEYARECKQYVREKALNKNIFIIGFHSDIVPLLADNDCLLCASRQESFPSSIVEAMTYDLTILSTPVAGVPELLKDGDNSYISTGYDAADIVDCIKRCYEDYKNGWIEELQKKARELWRKEFSPNVIRAQLEEYYQYILKDYQEETAEAARNMVFLSEIRATYDRIYEIGKTAPVVLRRCYYYTCLISVLKKGTAYIWGAGKYGKLAKELLERLYPGIKILAYIDRRESGSYQGIPVIYPEQMDAEQADYCFIGLLREREQIIECLQEKGFEYNKNAWLLP